MWELWAASSNVSGTSPAHHQLADSSSCNRYSRFCPVYSSSRTAQEVWTGCCVAESAISKQLSRLGSASSYLLCQPSMHCLLHSQGPTPHFLHQVPTNFHACCFQLQEIQSLEQELQRAVHAAATVAASPAHCSLHSAIKPHTTMLLVECLSRRPASRLVQLQKLTWCNDCQRLLHSSHHSAAAFALA